MTESGRVGRADNVPDTASSDARFLPDQDFLSWGGSGPGRPPASPGEGPPPESGPTEAFPGTGSPSTPAETESEPLTAEEQAKFADLVATEKRLVEQANRLLRDLKRHRLMVIGAVLLILGATVVPIIVDEATKDRSTPLPELIGGKAWKTDSPMSDQRRSGEGSPGEPYAIGDPIRTAGWTFAIVGVVPDVSTELLAEDPSTHPAGAENRYLRIEYEATRDEPVTPETAPQAAEIIVFEYLSETGVNGLEIVTLGDGPGGIDPEPSTIIGEAPSSWPDQVSGSLVFRMPKGGGGELSIKVIQDLSDAVLVTIPEQYPIP